MFSRCRKKPEEPPPPKAPIPRSEFKDPPLPTVELQTLAHLVGSDQRSGGAMSALGA